MKKWPPDYDRAYLPSSSSIYWDERSETMDPAKREQEIIIPKLQSQLAYAYENSPFYRKSGLRSAVPGVRVRLRQLPSLAGTLKMSPR